MSTFQGSCTLCRLERNVPPGPGEQDSGIWKEREQLERRLAHRPSPSWAKAKHNNIPVEFNSGGMYLAMSAVYQTLGSRTSRPPPASNMLKQWGESSPEPTAKQYAEAVGDKLARTHHQAGVRALPLASTTIGGHVVSRFIQIRSEFKSDLTRCGRKVV